MKAVLVLAVGAWIAVLEGSAALDGGARTDPATPAAREVVQEARSARPCFPYRALPGPVQPEHGASRGGAPPPLLTVAASDGPRPDDLVIPECVPLASTGGAPPASP